MYMNGVMTGMIAAITKTAQRTIRRVLHPARAVCVVAVAGATMPSIAVLLVVATTTRTTAPTIWDSACSAVQSETCPKSGDCRILG